MIETIFINDKGEGYQQVLDEVIRIPNNDESKVKSLLEMLRSLKRASIIEVKESKRKFGFILLILSYAIFFNSFIQGLPW